jgi:DNA-directed RNA polymerase specialized sigma24 family protein
MSSADSISRWIDQLKAGDPAAAQRLWERYFARLVGLARKKLRTAPRRAADEEDVALSAFDSFIRGADAGRFPQLDDRNNLWRLLVVITSRKAGRLVQHERRQKRGGGVHHEETRGPGDESVAGVPALEQAVDPEPTPEFAALVSEECERLLDKLGDPDLRALALWRMEGYTIEEIAGRLGCVPRTVERRLRVIRSLWSQEMPQ